MFLNVKYGILAQARRHSGCGHQNLAGPERGLRRNRRSGGTGADSIYGTASRAKDQDRE